MQTKTIERLIRTKMNEWIKSLTDLTLQQEVKDNILVSGGCITSMYLGIEVNDYDVYLNDKKVLLKLTEYYTKKFSEVIILDGNKREELLLTIENKYGGKEYTEIHNAYCISVRNLKENQIKLFFESKSGGIKVNETLDLKKFKYSPVFLSPNAISLSDNVQIVLRFHGNNEEIHETFDFIHATNYFTFKEGLVTNKYALESILTKQLRYQGSQYPLTSIIRMKKFIQRNWRISAGEILKIMFQISELDLKNPDVLEEQLIGVDVAYFSLLIEILRGVEKETITSKYLNTIIDRVFNSSEEEI